MSLSERRCFMVGDVYLFKFGGGYSQVSIIDVVGDVLRLRGSPVEWMSAAEFVGRDPVYYGKEFKETRWFFFKKTRVVRDRQAETHP